MEGVERCGGATRQNSAHGLIAGHEDKTFVARIVEKVVGRAGFVGLCATFERALRGGRKPHVLFGNGGGFFETDVTVGCGHRRDSGGDKEG